MWCETLHDPGNLYSSAPEEQSLRLVQIIWWVLYVVRGDSHCPPRSLYQLLDTGTTTRQRSETQVMSTRVVNGCENGETLTPDPLCTTRAEPRNKTRRTETYAHATRKAASEVHKGTGRRWIDHALIVRRHIEGRGSERCDLGVAQCFVRRTRAGSRARTPAGTGTHPHTYDISCTQPLHHGAWTHRRM